MELTQQRLRWRCRSAAFSILILLFGGVVVVPAFEIFGYVPHHHMSNVDWEAVMPMLTYVMLFSVEVSPRGDLVNLDRLPHPESDLAKRIKFLAEEHSTKILVTVGGAGRSTGFGVVVDNPELRAKLVREVCEFVEERELDGVDFDIAIPPQEEHQNKLGEFFKELQRELRKKDKIVSLAVHPGPRQRIPQSVIDHADFLHLMAYDNWCAFPPTARPPCKHSEYHYAQSVIKQFLGVPHVKRELTTLGVPFYGRHVSTGQAKSYRELSELHPEASPGVDELDEHYFNGAATVRAKVELAFNYRLAGVMIWDISQDLPPSDPKALLPQMYQVADELMKSYQHEEEL